MFFKFNKAKGVVGKTITGMKPKPTPSKATTEFQSAIKQIDEGLDAGIKGFKKENPNRQITEEQIKKVKKDKKDEMMVRERKALLRANKKKGGRIGFSKGTGRTGVPAMDIKTKISLAKKKKNKKSDFGMLSVKAGIDKNPNPTHADRIAAGKMKDKKKVI
tara:strand:- start:26 stop:508 length:483 start_codon:yes stop_codon:yes gene_type:complete